jgi:hypothetical protein
MNLTLKDRYALSYLNYWCNKQLMDRQIAKVCCFGSGYVGTPTMAVMALNNPAVKV